MLKQSRFWFPGAIYHITWYGKQFFYDKNDYSMYLSILEDVRLYYPFYLHSYCLLPSHTHLLIETNHSHIKDIIKKLHNHYTFYLNNRYTNNHLSPILSARYRSELIVSAQLFLKASRNIHTRPKEEPALLDYETYQWSSYPAYVTPIPNAHVVTSRILSFFPDPQLPNYKKFVEGIENSINFAETK